MAVNHDSASDLRTHDILLIAGIVIFAAVVRVPSLTQPLGPDQGIMSVIGEGILQGKLPYKDFWEMGSPAIFLTYALMFKLFGASMSAIPIADMLVSMLTTLLIFAFAKMIWSKNIGYVSALLFAFFSNGVRLGMHAGGDVAFGTFWYIGQRETFMLPLIVSSFYLLLRSERTGWSLVRLTTAGLLAGLAFVYKFPSLLIFFWQPIYLNLSMLRFGMRGRDFLKKNAALGAGFAFSLLPFAVFFWVRKAMPEMIDIIFRYVYSVYGQVDHSLLGLTKMALTRTFFIAEENFILWIFFLVSALHIVVNERRKESLLVIFWGIASLLYLISHREFFGYHYLILLPPLSLLAGYGLIRALGPRLELRKVVTAEFGKAFIILALVANGLFFATLNYMHYTKFYYYVTGKINRETYYSYFNAYPKHSYSFPADYDVARYLVANTNDGDTIFTLGGTESVIHFLTKRSSPSRFIFSWILFSRSHGGVERAEGYRKELLDSFVQSPPKYIVSLGALDEFKYYREIYSFMASNYVLEKQFRDDRFVYVHRTRRGLGV